MMYALLAGGRKFFTRPQKKAGDAEGACKNGSYFAEKSLKMFTRNQKFRKFLISISFLPRYFFFKMVWAN